MRSCVRGFWECGLGMDALTTNTVAPGAKTRLSSEPATFGFPLAARAPMIRGRSRSPISEGGRTHDRLDLADTNLAPSAGTLPAVVRRARCRAGAGAGKAR